MDLNVLDADQIISNNEVLAKRMYTSSSSDESSDESNEEEIEEKENEGTQRQEPVGGKVEPELRNETDE